MKLENFLDNIISQYKLWDKVGRISCVILRVEKCMHGLKSSGIIAYKLLEETLEEHGYHQSDKTPGFWKHDTRPIRFSLLVDDFGIECVGEEHAHHLLLVLKEFYAVYEHWEARQKYCGITMDWDYL
jgi:hypothetical protein